MARFILIHGSCHGAWCWHDLLHILDTGVHEATAIDLPSHGADRTPAAKVTLDLYAEAITDAIGSGPPVILVGHSMAGYPIPAAAERAPEAIAKQVPLCVYVPTPDQSLAGRRRAAPAPHPPLRRPPEVDHRPRGPRRGLLPRLPARHRRLRRRPPPPQPVLPQETALTLTALSAGIPKAYIRCTDDRTIPPEWQEHMTAGRPPAAVTTLPTSHSPFFAAPAMLAERLREIAE